MEVWRRVLDECLNGCYLGTGGIVAGGAVPKRDGSVTGEVPGGVGRRRAGEGVGRKILRKESWSLVSTNLLDVVDCVVGMTSGTN